MTSRTAIGDLQLTGSPNLGRALKREAAERNAPPRTVEQESEIARVDELISLAMRACRRGQTIRGRRNPAFANLESLVKVRKALESRKIDPAAAGQHALKEAQELLAGLERKAN